MVTYEFMMVLLLLVRADGSVSWQSTPGFVGCLISIPFDSRKCNLVTSLTYHVRLEQLLK